MVFCESISLCRQTKNNRVLYPLISLFAPAVTRKSSRRREIFFLTKTRNRLDDGMMGAFW